MLSRSPRWREITVTTDFRGHGAPEDIATDARGVTEDRYVLDPELARPERAATLARFVFRVGESS